MRLINADELEVVAITGESGDFARGAAFILEKIDSMPTIEAEPVRHGRWKLHNDGSGTCDQCHFTQKNVWDFDNCQNYCGVCGAKMDLEGE